MNIAAIDVGLKRIGLALCLHSGIVIPKEAVFRKNRNQAASEIKEFLDNWNIDKLVVGLPKGGSSKEEMKKRITFFVSLIRFEGEIVYVDESYTSKEAIELTKGQFRHKRDGKIDSISAKLILERYLKIKYI